MPTETVHAERSPKGEVEACEGADLPPFDSAALRSGRAVLGPVRAERNS